MWYGATAGRAAEFNRTDSFEINSSLVLKFAAGAASPGFNLNHQPVSIVRTDPLFLFLFFYSQFLADCVWLAIPHGRMGAHRKSDRRHAYRCAIEFRKRALPYARHLLHDLCKRYLHFFGLVALFDFHDGDVRRLETEFGRHHVANRSIHIAETLVGGTE